MSIAELNEEDLAHRVSTVLSKNILFDHVDNELNCDDLTVAICKAIEPHLKAVFDNGYRSGVLQEWAIIASEKQEIVKPWWDEKTIPAEIAKYQRVMVSVKYLLAQWREYQSSRKNQEEAYYMLAKYASQYWHSLEKSVAELEVIKPEPKGD